MKQYLPLRFLCCILAVIAISSFTHRAMAQAGPVYTLAGGGTDTTNGVPASSAAIALSTGLGADALGNVYYADMGRSIVRRVDALTGLVHTVAGMSGIVGFSGDGGPATAAKLSNSVRGIHVTAAGHIYIADDTRIRCVNAFTGLITTVAGGGSSTSDGVAATTSSISVKCVYVDVGGNIYLGTHNKIRKVSAATGIITTIAGNGVASDLGDGGPATAASVSGSARSICMDNAGNLYINSVSGSSIRKIDAATGIINTVAGGGTSTAEGVPATNAILTDVHSCGVDGAGNIFIGDWSRGLVRRVDAVTGVINTIAGVGSGGGSSADGSPALSANVSPYMLLVNTESGNIYYSNFDTKVRGFYYYPMGSLIGGGAYTSDSMAAYIYKQCSGPQITVRTNSYHAGMTVRTYFGDGSADTSVIGTSWSLISGFVRIDHVYPAAGTYTIQHILCNAGVPVDTLSYNYDHVFCANIPVYFYNDIDFNCVKSSTEPFIMRQVVTRVDSNGVPVDTLVASSGFHYLAYGTPGDIYTFRIISTPSGLQTTCPATGIIYDTLHLGATTGTTHFMALACTAGSYTDLDARAFVPVTGPNDQWGHIYVRNNYCLPADASVTLNFSPKYRYGIGANPAPVSSTATSLTWSLSSLMGSDSGPRDIYYVVWHNPAVPYPVDGDTVNEHIVVTPTSGPADINMANNIVIRVDTVRTSCDPNAIEVKPACFDNDTTLHFTVHFENIGSAPAVNIYVMDTLSPFLDPATFSIDMTTHPMFITKHFINNKTIFKFDFPNINLADSSDHENRDGMFMYTIRNRPSMTTGMPAHSRVGIYFDYNDVLMTNTATTTKGCPKPASFAEVKIPTFNLYPNPVSDALTIEAQPGRYSRLTISNMVGQQLLQQDVRQPLVNVSVKHLPPGLYFVTMQGANGNDVNKFVKH